MWQMGELERNFMIMHTSSGAGENIIGDCNTENKVELNSEGLVSWQKYQLWLKNEDSNLSYNSLK